MSLNLTLSDLSRLDNIRQVLEENDQRGQFQTLGIHQLTISDTALDTLTDVIDRLLTETGRPTGKSAQICMVADPVAITLYGRNLKDAVFNQLSERYDASRITLDDGHTELHADEVILDTAAEGVTNADCVVTVGSGTITDIGKVAAQRSNVPVHVVVQTAASVDGFTDDVSIILQNGVKCTVHSRWPDAVLTDTRIIAEAPHYLNASGFGELLSMYCGPGDWFLASRMGMDDTFAPVLLELLSLCGEGIQDWSGGIGHGEVESSRRLASALAMRGIVTGVGGTTASLSGMEHLFSHMLDMVNGERQGPMGLHGAQVGVGSVIRAATWEIFCELMDESPVQTENLFLAPSSFERTVKSAFIELDPSGRISEECWTRYRAKLNKWQEARPQVEAFFADWKDNRKKHNELILGSYTIAKSLYRAKASMRYSDLYPETSKELARWVVSNCQFMRPRFTVADLMLLSGWWDDTGVDRVLERVEAACTAAEESGR